MPSTAPVSARSRRFARLACVAVLIGCGVAVAGCNSAIEAVRSVRGITKNDPDPATAPFTGNMTEAEAIPYPNLASVPPPPSRATTTTERQKLTEKLVAERAAAATQWAGSSWAASPAPAPPASSLLAANTAGPATPSVSPSASPLKRVAAAGDPFSPHRAASGPPAEPPPRDSAVLAPQVRARPEPEELRVAPPKPGLPPVQAPESAQLPPAAVASATPQPALPIPQLAPIAPPSPSLAKPDLAKPAPPRMSGPTTVAMLDAVDSGHLDPAQISQVAARYKEHVSSQPLRAIRVIAYTAMPEPGADPLGGYHDALDRAQGIAKVLTEAGIPEKMIQTEAKPAAGPLAASRVEIQFLP